MEFYLAACKPEPTTEDLARIYRLSRAVTPVSDLPQTLRLRTLEWEFRTASIIDDPQERKLQIDHLQEKSLSADPRLHERLAIAYLEIGIPEESLRQAREARRIAEIQIFTQIQISKISVIDGKMRVNVVPNEGWYTLTLED